MGLFDLPAPLFAWLDAHLAGLLPAGVRLLLWAVLGALISMGLYRLLSPQARIAQGKLEIARARTRLNAFDGELHEAWPFMRAMLRAALAQVGRTFGPAVLASLPLLALLGWLSTAYGHDWPAAGVRPEVRTEPNGLQAEWVAAEATRTAPRVRISAQGLGVLADVPLTAPVPVVHKRQWWNALLGNPAGYLPRDAVVDEIRIALPKREYLGFGPHWARGWEVSFFLVLILVSLALKRIARIE